MTSPAGLFNPFPGLRPFEPEEDFLFFGREEETDEVLRRLRTNRFLLVVGTSGMRQVVPHSIGSDSIFA